MDMCLNCLSLGTRHGRPTARRNAVPSSSSPSSPSLHGLLTAGGALACIATLAGFAGHLHWLPELASHFRLQYAIALALLAAVMLARAHYRWALLFVSGALLNTLLLTPRLLPPAEASATADEPRLRLLLANVRAENRAIARIQAMIDDSAADLVVLLEVTPELAAHLESWAGRYPYRQTMPRNDYFGIALLSRLPFQKAEVVTLSAAGLPSIIAELGDGKQRFTLIGTHPLPPVSAAAAADRNAQFAALAMRARQTHTPLVLAGDLNTSPWSPWFARLLRDSGLRDSADGRGLHSSWPAGWPLLWIPIDHVLVSTDIRIQDRRTGADFGSDHYPVIVDFQVASR